MECCSSAAPVSTGDYAADRDHGRSIRPRQRRQVFLSGDGRSLSGPRPQASGGAPGLVPSSMAPGARTSDASYAYKFPGGPGRCAGWCAGGGCDVLDLRRGSASGIRRRVRDLVLVRAERADRVARRDFAPGPWQKPGMRTRLHVRLRAEAISGTEKMKEGPMKGFCSRRHGLAGWRSRNEPVPITKTITGDGRNQRQGSPHDSRCSLHATECDAADEGRGLMIW